MYSNRIVKWGNFLPRDVYNVNHLPQTDTKSALCVLRGDRHVDKSYWANCSVSIQIIINRIKKKKIVITHPSAKYHARANMISIIHTQIEYLWPEPEDFLYTELYTIGWILRKSVLKFQNTAANTKHDL